MNLNLQENSQSTIERNKIATRISKMFTIRQKAEISTINRNEETRELIDCINAAKKEWMDANKNFEFAQEEDIIDYYIYKIKAYQVKYNYLIKHAKQKGVKVEIVKSVGQAEIGSSGYARI